MNMIGHPTHGQEPKSQIIRRAYQIGPKVLLQLRRNQIAPFLGAENTMYEIGGVGVGHCAVPCGDSLVLEPTPRLRAGLMNRVPCGDSRIRTQTRKMINRVWLSRM